MPKDATLKKADGTSAHVGAAVRAADVDVRFRTKKKDVTALTDVSLDVAAA